MLADVIELVADHRAMLMHRISDLAEMRNDFVARMAEVAARQHTRAVNGNRLHHDHAGSAPRPLFVISPVPLARQPGFGHVGGVSAKDNTVSQRLVAKLKGLEQGWKGV